MTYTHVMVVCEDLLTTFSAKGINVRGVPLHVVGGDENCPRVYLHEGFSSFRLFKGEFMPHSPAILSIEEML